MDERETRGGVRFYGAVSYVLDGCRLCKTAQVTLYVEGQEEPIGTWVRNASEGTADQLVDLVFHAMVEEGPGSGAHVESPELTELFVLAQMERSRGVPWYELSHRFVRARNMWRPTKQSIEGLNFIFTPDKGDISPKILAECRARE